MNAPTGPGGASPGTGAADSGDDEAGDAAALSDAKAKDAAFILPLAGLAAFSPPALGLFAVDGRIFGAPAIVVYVFCVWAALIASALVLSRRLAGKGARGSRR